MNNTAILYMGGTFGCVGEPLTPMPASTFIELLQQSCHFENEKPLHYFAAPSIKDSTELQASDWLELGQFIHQLIHQNFKHFVLIHGTDTLNYAAAFLHHIFAQDISLIITGSQYPLFDTQGQSLHRTSDAWLNLQFAIRQIDQIPPGIYVGFNQQLFAANQVYKLHTKNYQAFYGQEIQHVSNSSLHFIQKLQPQHIGKAQQIRLLNYYISPDCSTHLAENLALFAQNPPNILILQAFGSGNLPYSETIKHNLKQLLQQGCWIILSSQVLFGELSQQYATGSWLNEVGVVFDPHYSQADTYARAILLYLQSEQSQNWPSLWYS
ncbi:asparaginase [Acinetobacter qingfengensis]|uniref:L-asparaginase N-terminal domain-containing protein n=1 Tax=Acinetobacter qingfengensis TaxID=1262585 RepID=A0A1E7R1F2_9GAMM|nr:asparaginase domain-containing protein [Acinetobacter qingfengensis]KAA8733241.1 asparaginase [Acinetobacter qingfengensis]OEY93126.1 hypothetical protein BJI46_05135 [Acinetobacter qingfengensis]